MAARAYGGQSSNAQSTTNLLPPSMRAGPGPGVQAAFAGAPSSTRTQPTNGSAVCSMTAFNFNASNTLFDHTQGPYGAGAGVGMHSVSDKVNLASSLTRRSIDADGLSMTFF